MSRLQVLPPNIANLIAAGEVVQRPSSVVKEMMENAVDAGATSVSVIITDAGRTLIQVIDNGCGMSPEDAVLCFERHATSKIASPEDLNEILTYGFRGEALASIAAVADVTLRTRRAGDEAATEVTVESSGKVTTKEVAAPVGSNFAVRNLFYNTPARRKFLKSDNVELKHIIEEFTRVALTRPETAFTLVTNGRETLVLKAAKSLKFRIMDILGPSVVGEVVDINAETSIAKVNGYLGRPDVAKKTLGNQFFFVNGRYFRSSYLHKAVMKAYENFIPEGVTPSYFIYLEVDPHTIDVNIHPTKTEIKFEEDSVLFQILFASVKEALGKNSFGASIDFDSAGAVELPVFTKNFEEFHPVGAPSANLDPDYDPFESSPVPSSPKSFPQASSQPSSYSRNIAPNFDFDHQAEPRVNYGKLFEEKTLPTTQILIIQGKYIIVPARSGVMVVHVRRARERILYERFLRAFSANEHVVQTALFPVQVNIGAANKLIFDENAAMLSSLGFDISPFGNDTIVVNGVPEGYSCDASSVEKMIDDLLAVLSEQKHSLKETMASATAARFAALGAAPAPAITSPFEAQKLIDRLLACDNAEFTSNGRRIISIESLEELEKKF